MVLLSLEYRTQPTRRMSEVKMVKMVKIVEVKVIVIGGDDR